MPRLVLVTGGAGAVGATLVDALRNEGWRVRALVRRRPVPAADEEVRADLVAGDLWPAVAGADAVLHLAALTHARRARDYELVNVHGTQRLLGAAREAGIRRFVHVSTRAIAAEGGAYSASKRAAEEAVRASGLEFAVVRLPELYGGGGREGVDRVLEQACKGGFVPLVGSGSDEVCPLLVDDVVGPVVAALTRPEAAGNTYTLAGECLTVRAFAAAAARVCGTEVRPVPVPTPLLRAAALAARALPLPLYPDQLARLRAPKPAATPEAGSDLGFAPTPLAEGLARAVRRRRAAHVQ